MTCKLVILGLVPRTWHPGDNQFLVPGSRDKPENDYLRHEREGDYPIELHPKPDTLHRLSPQGRGWA